jgi:dolichol-phosphate mannosyltransferase
VRTKERGLSSAVLRGFNESRGEYLICMDADLQHPPESVPAILAKMDTSIQLQPVGDEALQPRSKPKRQQLNGDDYSDKKEIEFVIGTRYFQSSDPSVVSIDKDWPLYRRVISSGARMLARPLTPLSDPMTGFFGLRRDVFQRANRSGIINPIGFKIALELYVKCRVRLHAEIPIIFGVRVHGESKLSSKVIFGYLRHLRELYDFVFPGLLIGLLVLGLILLSVAAVQIVPLLN